MLKRSHIILINCIGSLCVIIAAIAYALDYGTNSPSTGLYSQYPPPPAQMQTPKTLTPPAIPVVIKTMVPVQNFTTSPMPASMTGEVSVTPIDRQQATIQLVNNAVNLIKQRGRDMAFAEFNRNPGLFSRGISYLFAVNFNGTMLANGFDPNLIGGNVFDIRNHDGVYIYQVLMDKAKNGGGWVQYRELNPESNQIECKRSYVIQVDGEFYVGSGFYYPMTANGGC